MKITVCDFCGNKVESGGIRFNYKKKTYRVDISVYNTEKASKTDACAVCTFKYAVRAAKAILKKNKK